MKKFGIGSLFFIFCFCLVSAQEIEISKKVSPLEIAVGDLVHYEITATLNNKTQLLSEPQKINWGNFKVLDYKVTKKKLKHTKKLLKIDYTGSFYKTGEETIPTLNLQYREKNELAIYQLPPTSIKIKSILTDKNTKLKDIKPTFKLTLDKIYYFIGFLFVLGLVLLASGWFYYRQIFQKKKLGQAVMQKTPYQVALEKIKKLEKAKLLEAGKIKKFYARLTEIGKEYFATTFALNIQELTTMEINLVLTEKTDLQTLKRITNFLTFCDQVKFAKYKPSSEENREMVAKIYEIMERIEKKCL
jgi:hypothetical protein